MKPAILLGAEATGLTVTIDGVTYRPVAVNASGQLIVVGAGTGGAMSVAQATPDSLRVGVYGRYSGAWQRQPLAFGFSARYYEFLSPAAAAGTNNVDGTACPANTLRVLTGLQAVNQTSATTRIITGVVSGGNHNRVRTTNGGAAFTHVDWQGAAYLLSGDTPRVTFEGCTLNDALRVTYYGFDMTLNL